MINVSKFFSDPHNITYNSTYIETLPKFNLPEISFAGRSNVGKSSLINALTKRKKLASVSSNPGHTRKINFYEISNKLILVDLPGYGYVKVSKGKSEFLSNLIYYYLKDRKNLKILFLLIDCRHGLKENDQKFIKLLNENNINYLLILTKIDKVSQINQQKTIETFNDFYFRNKSSNLEIFRASSLTGEGIKNLRKKIINLAI